MRHGRVGLRPPIMMPPPTPTSEVLLISTHATLPVAVRDVSPDMHRVYVSMWKNLLFLVDGQTHRVMGLEDGTGRFYWLLWEGKLSSLQDNQQTL